MINYHFLKKDSAPWSVFLYVSLTEDPWCVWLLVIAALSKDKLNNINNDDAQQLLVKMDVTQRKHNSSPLQR
jgi:hypothetical protein